MNPAGPAAPDPGVPPPHVPAPDIHDLYENAASGHLTVGPDGRVSSLNATLASWLRAERDAVVGRAFTDLLGVGSRIHYETHFAPLLQLTGYLSGIAVELAVADGSRLSVLLSANVKQADGTHPPVIRMTMQDARARRSYERELLEQRRRADLARAQADELATTLQRSLIPPSLAPPPGLDAQAHYHPASMHNVGGDFYDLFPLAERTWGFFLGDVSGKGAGAAAVTSLTRYTLRAAAVYDDDPVTVLHNLDTVLAHEFRGDDPRFCTVVFGLLAPNESGCEVHLAAGGHPPALVIRADGSAAYVDTAGGQAVGILPNPRFVSARVHLFAGDTLVLYTDGLTEARVPGGRYDDSGALLQFAAASGPTTATTIVDALRALVIGLGDGVEDDVAIMAVSVPPAPVGDTPST